MTMEHIVGWALLVIMGSMAFNLIILGYVIKLYTEYFKDRSQQNRGAK